MVCLRAMCEASAPTLMTNAAFRTMTWDMRFHVPATAFKDKERANECVFGTNHNCHPTNWRVREEVP